MQSHIIEPLRVEPEPIRTEPDLTDRIRSARYEPPSGAGGGAARESGVAGEEKGLATQVAAPFLSRQPPPDPNRNDPTRPVMARHDTN